MVVSKTAAANSFIFKIIFLCIFAISLLLGIVLTDHVRSVPGNRAVGVQYIDHWNVIDRNGQSFRVGRTYDDERAYTEDFTIVSQLPEKVENGDLLCFLNRSNVRVYINGELRRDFDKIRNTGIPGGSLKEFYLKVPLSASDAGAEVRIERGKTDRNPMVVSETFVASADSIYHYMLKKYGLSFFLSVILLIASLLAAIIGFIMRIRYKQTIDMLYAALGIFDIACWLISISQFTPIVTEIYYIDGFMGFMFCMLMTFGLLIYFNSLQKGRYFKCHAALFILSLLSMIFWTAIHFAGIQSLQTSLIYIDSVLGLVVVCVLVTLFLDARKGFVQEYKYTARGFLIFMVMSLLEILKLIFFEQLNNELPMLTGLFSLLIFAVFQQVEDIRKVKEQLTQEVHDKTVENQQMLIHIVQTLAGTIDAKDTYTKGHSGRVADYSREIARRYGYDEYALNDIYMMGLLHDIGKIGIPDAIINKPGKLTDEEYELIKKHPVMGAKILENIKEKSELAMGAKWHHEKYGGGGYPDGIKGEAIPEQARIIAVADAYDAMTSYRSYRDPMPQARVREEIEKGSGTQFDPRFADIMLDMIAEDPDYQLREKK